MGLPSFAFLPGRGRLLVALMRWRGGMKRNRVPKNKKPTYQVNLWRWALGQLLLDLLQFAVPRRHTRAVSTARTDKGALLEIKIHLSVYKREVHGMSIFYAASSTASGDRS